MRDILKMGLILFIITAVAGLLLGSAYELTKGPIALQTQKANEEAMKVILPEADRFEEEIQISEEDLVQSVVTGYQGNTVVGYAVKVSPKGYGGAIEMMVGISQDGILQGIQILKHAETPGLGANAQNESFTSQFAQKPTDSPLTVVKGTSAKENEVEAITGATITSRAVSVGVNTVIEYYHQKLSAKGGQ